MTQSVQLEGRIALGMAEGQTLRLPAVMCFVLFFFFGILKVQQEIRFGRSVSKTIAQLKEYSIALTPGHVFGNSRGKVLAWANATISNWATGTHIQKH